MTKGQLIQIDPIWAPAQSNASDADGTAVIHQISTASYVDGALSANKLPLDVQITREAPNYPTR